MLIGDRPGLSSCDSLGADLTWHPQPGRTDAERDCIPSIRESGLNSAPTAIRILWYPNAARTERITGLAPKDGSKKLSAGQAFIAR